MDGDPQPCRFSISEIGQNALKDIAAAAPEALIPSYHREISGLVEQKTAQATKKPSNN
ncbi:hypothetical protein PO124_21855 [Bacillus licheniformis]|nr:hypothetical protein [Bacillus licheniformis]